MMITLLSQNNRRRAQQPFYAALQICVGFMLLACFLLPNTVWAIASPFSAVMRAFKFDVVVTTGQPHLWRIWGYAAAIGAVAVLVLRWRASGRPDRRLYPAYLTGLYLVPYVATLSMNDNSGARMAEAGTVLITVAIGFSVVLLCCRQAQQAAVLICSLAAVQAIFTISYQRSGINTLLSGAVERAGGTFNRPYDVYMLMLPAVLITLSRILDLAPGNSGNAAPSPWQSLQKWLAILCGAICFAALLLTWYRGPMIGLAVGLTWLVVQRSKSRLTALSVGACMVTLILFVGFHRMHGAVNQRSSFHSIQGRRYLWSKACATIAEHPWGGIGVANLTILIRTPQPNHPDVVRVDYSHHPNSLLLLWLAEMGIPGGILFAMFVAAIAQTITRALQHKAVEPVAASIGAAWLAFAVISLFDTTFGTAIHISGNVLFGALIAATLLVGFQTAPQECRRPQNKEAVSKEPFSKEPFSKEAFS